MDTAFQSAAEQGRRVLTRAQINQVLSARSARKFPYSTYGRKVYRRGTPAGVAKYGTSQRSATPMQRQQRSMDGIIGSGAYLGRTLGAAAGSYLGGAAGAAFGPGGAAVGSGAGWWAGRIAGNVAEDALLDYAVRKGPSLTQIPTALYRGAGAYKRVRAYSAGRVSGSGAYTQTNTQTNSLFKGGMGVAQFASTSDETGALHITHCEYIQDVLGTADFTNNAFPINPGDPALFPWLSQIAANYDEYEFSGLIFTFRSVTGDLATSTAQLGTVIMCTNYNAGSAPFTSKQAMMEYDGAARVKINEDLMSGVECDKSKMSGGGSLFVALNGTVPDGQDLKTYYHGLFQIAVNASSSTGQIGELWVSYKVTLRKPKFAVTIGLQIPTSVLTLAMNASTITVSSGALITPSPNTIYTTVAQFNNLEDVNYTGGVFPSSLQVVSRGLPNAASLTKNYAGWQLLCTAGFFQLFYMVPSWLQNGTYKASVTFKNVGSGGTPTGTWSVSPAAAATGNGLTLLSSYVPTASTSVVAIEKSATACVSIYRSQQNTGVPQYLRFEFLASAGTLLYGDGSEAGVGVFQCEFLQVNNQIASVLPAPLA